MAHKPMEGHSIPSVIGAEHMKTTLLAKMTGSPLLAEIEQTGHVMCW